MSSTNILQGSNTPLVITFDQDVSGLSKLSISLWHLEDGELLKAWTRDYVDVDGAQVSCPLTEEESAAFPQGHIVLEAKGAGADGEVLFWEQYVLKSKQRFDKGIYLNQTEE